MKKHLVWLLCALGVILFATIARVQAQEDLKEPAREPFKRGLVAAQQKQFDLAIEYFDKALQADGDAPQVWFNLALASAQVPGREFRAIALFKAFLLANPQAANRAAIEAHITALDVRIEGNLRKLVQESRRSFPIRKDTCGRNADLLESSTSEVFAGLLDQSETTAAEVRGCDGDLSQIVRQVRRAEALAIVGEIGRAEAVLRNVVDASKKSGDWVRNAKDYHEAESSFARVTIHRYALSRDVSGITTAYQRMQANPQARREDKVTGGALLACTLHKVGRTQEAKAIAEALKGVADVDQERRKLMLLYLFLEDQVGVKEAYGKMKDPPGWLLDPEADVKPYQQPSNQRRLASAVGEELASCLFPAGFLLEVGQRGFDFVCVITEPSGRLHMATEVEVDCAPPAGEISSRFEGSAIGGFGLLNYHFVFLRG